MDIKLKDERVITLEKQNKETLEGGNGVYNAYSPNHERVGFLRYKYDEKLATIDMIAITDDDYVSCGVGHALLCAFENDMKATKAKRIVGVYMPKGLHSSKVKEFYINHGYQFTRDKKTNDILIVKSIGRGLQKAKRPINTEHTVIR